jgi:hypothetical protein
MSYESFPKMMVEKSHIDFGTLGSIRDNVKHSLTERPEQSTWIDLFAPVGHRLASLESIQTPEEFSADVVGHPKTSLVNGVQRRRYGVRINAIPEAMRYRGGGSFARSVTFVSDDGSSVMATLLWRQSEHYRVAPSPLFFGTVNADGSSNKVEVLVSTSIEESVTIDSITSDSDYLIVEKKPIDSELPPGKHQKLVLILSVPSSVDQNALSGTVCVAMADKEGTAVTIPWSAFVRRPTVSSAAHSAVPIGTRKEE